MILLYCYCLRLFGQKKNSKEQHMRTENQALEMNFSYSKGLGIFDVFIGTVQYWKRKVMLAIRTRHYQLQSNLLYDRFWKN